MAIKEIDRLIEARKEVTRIYANFPLDLQKRLDLRSDIKLQEEITKLEKDFALRGNNDG